MFTVLDIEENTKATTAMFEVNGTSLKVIKALDFEQNNQWTVTIKVTGKYGENQPVDMQDEFSVSLFSFYFAHMLLFRF